MPTDTSSLLWGLLFGPIGLGFLILGKRQLLLVALGIARVAFPNFVRL